MKKFPLIILTVCIIVNVSYGIKHGTERIVVKNDPKDSM